MYINIKLDFDFEQAFQKLVHDYGQDLAKLNGFAEKQLDYTTFIDNFIDKSTNVAANSIDANANVSVKDVTSLLNEMSKPHMKLLSMSKVFYELKKAYGLEFAKKWLEMEWTGIFYLHDAFNSSFLSYCFSYDLSSIATRGLFFVQNFNAQPPKHLGVFVDFAVEFVSWVSNRTSGGCSLPNFLVWAYYFWKKDVDNGYYLKSPEIYRDQELSRYIYKLNQPYIRVTQAAYTTMTIMDKNYLVELFGGMEYPDGTFVVDYIDEILDFQKAFVKELHKIRHQNMMTFPVCSYALIYDYDKNKFEDEELARWCSDENSYWLDFNWSIDDGVNALASCCRMRNGVTQKDLGRFSSIGGSALEVGSVKVNTINLARISYECKDLDDYIEILKERTRICCKVLNTIRHIIKRNVEKGLLPNYSLGIINIEKQYTTIGICALYDAIMHLGMIERDEFNYERYTEEGIKFAKRIFDAVTEIKVEAEKETGYQYNIEQIPGERACAVLMAKDKMFYPNVSYNGQLYSNQWLSLAARTTAKDKVAVGEALDSYMGGGVISHYNTDAPFPNKDVAWAALNYVARHRIPYFAFNGVQSSCQHNHGFYGDTCPTCGEKVTNHWTRVVGFTTPTSSFSPERFAEFKERNWDKPENYSLLF